MQPSVPVRPYPPSALDRLVARIDALPWHGWWLYPLVLGLSMAAIHLAVWAQGILPFGQLEPAAASFVFYAPFAVFAVHYLDRAGAHAMDVFRRALDLPEDDVARLRYELVTLPAGGLWVCLLFGAVFGSLVLLSQPDQLTATIGRTVPIAYAIAGPFSVLGYAGFAMFVWHTLRQLRLVTRLHAAMARVDLFDDGPLYAFSGLTMRTGLVWMATGWWSLVVSGSFVVESPIALTATVANFLFAAACFVLPLLGLHDRLVAEKSRLLGEANSRVRSVSADLYRRVDAGELTGIKEVTDALGGVVATRDQVVRLPTWPWPPQVLRGFVTALVLPVVVFLITRVISGQLR